MLISIAALLIALFAWLPLAHAENAFPCVGRDLIAEMKAKDPAAYERLVAEAAAIPNGDSVFWRIDGPPGTQPSWLLGTIHLSDPRVVTLDPKVADALDKASVVAIETRNNLDARGGGASPSGRPPGISSCRSEPRVFDLLSDSDAQLLREKLAAVGFDPDAQSRRTSLGCVFDHVIYPACERARARAGFEHLDLVIAYRALGNRTPVVGLEDPAAQSALLASIPMQDQIAYLASAIRVKHTMEDDAETAVVNWRDGQLALYLCLLGWLRPIDAGGNRRRHGAPRPIFSTSAISSCATARVPLLDKGNAFIAVGGYHLFGENGLVELLRKAGYKVTPVK